MDEENKKLELTLEQLKFFGDHLVDDALHRTAPDTQKLLNTLSKKFDGLKDDFAQHKSDRNKEIGTAIEKYVNGGIRGMRRDLSEHMVRVEPVIRAFEASKIRDELVDETGKRIIWWSKVISALGIIYLGFKYSIIKIITKT